MISIVRLASGIRRIAGSLADFFNDVASAVTDLSSNPSSVIDCSPGFFNESTICYKARYKVAKEFSRDRGHCPSKLDAKILEEHDITLEKALTERKPAGSCAADRFTTKTNDTSKLDRVLADMANSD